MSPNVAGILALGLYATVAVANFTLEDPTGQPNETGVGHYHFYLDKATGGNYLLAGSGPSADVKIPKGTAAGAHTLRCSLSDNAHAPFNPPVETTVDITVE